MMTTPIALLLEATERGFKFEAHGDQLHLIPLNPATRCPPDFAETLRAHKWHLLSMLSWPFVMVYSKTLGETIFFCEDEETKAALIEAGASEWSIYTREELRLLVEQHRQEPITAAELLKIHATKRTFNARIAE